MSAQTSPRYALVVGVDDYQIFDRSKGQEPSTSDLRGAVADAICFVHIAARAGVPVAHTRLLLAAASDADVALPEGVTAGRADRESVLDGLRWLAAGLEASEDAVGLLCFAGHGAASEDDLLLCGCDVGAGLESAVSYREIEQILGEAARSAALTVILDTAHGRGLTDPAVRSRSLTGQPLSEALAARELDLDAAIVRASASDAYAMEASFNGSYRGVLGHALEMLLGSFATGDATIPFQISANNLTARAQRLTVPLDLPQVPVASGSSSRLSDAVMAPRGTAAPTEGGLALLFGSELSPDTTETGFLGYTLGIQDRNDGKLGSLLTGQGRLIVTGGQFVPGSSGYSAGRTYWYFPPDPGGSNTPLDPFEVDASQSFVIQANLSITLSSQSAGSCNTCFQDQDFPTTASGACTFPGLLHGFTNSRYFKITNPSDPNTVIGYLQVSKNGTAQCGTNTDDKQYWVRCSVVGAATTLNPDIGKVLVFRLLSGAPSGVTGWSVTDNRL